MLIECWSRCQQSADQGLIEGIDRHWTVVAFSAHDLSPQWKGFFCPVTQCLSTLQQVLGWLLYLVNGHLSIDLPKCKWQQFEIWVVIGCFSLVLDTSFSSLFRNTPTLLWMTPYLGLDTPTGMEFLCVIGIVLSIILLVSQRCRDCLGYLMLWFLYYSMLPVSFVLLSLDFDCCNGMHSLWCN